MLGGEEEGVGELVFVDEEVGGEGEVRVQFARRVRGNKVRGGEGEDEGWVEAGGVLEGGGVG